MSLSLSQTKTALAVDLTASFLGIGGAEPYAYEVLADGAGGTIDSETGLYTAPAESDSDDPRRLYDTIRVTDDDDATATAQILVGTPLLLFCEVLQRELELGNGRVYLWDQKIFEPKDKGLYIAVSVPSCRPFGNNVAPDPETGWADAVQTVNMLATVDMDIISRGPAARDRKEEVIMALNSIYAQRQQEGNSFYIGKLPPGARFINLSPIDGAAIPYRFRISVNLQYGVKKTKAVDYFDSFEEVEVTTEP